MTRRDRSTEDMFEVPQPAEPRKGGLDYRHVVSELVGDALKEAEGDRFDVAARASRLAGRSISKYMLDAYSAGGREEFNVPLWAVPAIESACETHVLTNWLVGVRGGRLLLGREVLAAELGKLERLKEQTSQQIREVKKLMGDHE